MRELEISVEVQQAEAQSRLRATEDAFQRTEDAARNLGVAVDKADDALAGHAKQLSVIERAAKNAGLSVQDYRKQLKAETDAAVEAALVEKALGKETEELGARKKDAADATNVLTKNIRGLISVGVVVAAIKSASDYAARLQELSAMSGLSVVALQKIDASARSNGSSFEQVTRSIGVFQERLDGRNTSLMGALERLGLRYADLRASSPDEQFRILARAVTDIEEPLLKGATANDLFGASGRMLIPTLEDAAKNFAAYPVLSDDAAKSAARLSNAWDNLKQNGTILVADGIAKVGDALEWLMTKFDKATEDAPWIRLFSQNGLMLQAQHIWDTLAPTPPAIDAMSGWARQVKAAAIETSGLSAETARMNGAFDRWADGIEAGLNRQLRESQREHKEAERAAKDHERELTKLAENKAAKAMELLAKDVQSAYDRGLTAKEIYDAFGGKLLQAGREADTFRISLQKIAPVLDTTIKAAQEFKIAEILARANQDMHNELGRVIKEQGQVLDAARQERERKEYESNARVLQNYEDIEEAKARATVDRARGTMHEAEAEANYKIFQLDRWRQKELEALDKSSKDYGLLVSQIEEIYGVELQAVMDTYAQQHQTFWQRLRENAGTIYEGLVGSISGHFASMLTFAEGFKEGFVGIWTSIRDTFTNILADMLDYYLKRFIARLAVGLSGGSGGITGTILNAAGLNGGVGGTGTSGYLAQAAGGLLGIGGTSMVLADGSIIGVSTGAAGALGTSAGAVGAAGAGAGAGTVGAGGAAAGGASGGLTAAGLLGGAAAGGAGLGLGLLGTKIFGGSGWAASGFGAGTGAATGAAIGSIVPGIGTAVGAIVGGLAGFIGGWLGKSVGEKINDARDEFLKQFGGAGTGAGSGFAHVTADLARMDRLGMDGTEARRLIFNPKDWDDFNEGVRRLQAAFEDLRFVQDKVNESYAILQANGQKAMEQGASEVEVLKAQAAGYSEIYNTILRTGAEAPAGFEPVAQKLIEMGLLLDANGQKIENLYGLYEANAKRMVADTKDVNEAFGKLQSQQQALIDKGLEHEDVLRIQATGYSMLLDSIKSTGGQAPEAMRPILEDLINMGLLVDKAGNKITDLGGLFQETGAQGVDQLGQLGDALKDTTQQAEAGTKWWEQYRDRGVSAGGGIKDSLLGLKDTARDVVDDMQRTFDDFQPRPVRIPTEWSLPEQPDIVAHAGGYIDYSGLKRFHTGGLNRDERVAVLQTGEGVLSRRGMANLSRLNDGDGLGGGVVIQKGAIVVNGASDPEAVADEIMRKLRRKMKVKAA